MFSLRQLEGEVLIDHRDSPGVPEHMEVASGLAPGSTKGKKFECAVVSCRHCQRQIMLRPDRSRPRGFCRGCNRYLCDTCTAQYARDFTCHDIERQFAAKLEEAYRKASGTVHTGFAVRPSADDAPIASETPTVETPAESLIILPD